MSVIRQTDQAPETIDVRPMCECQREPECTIHPGHNVPAAGKFRCHMPGWTHLLNWLCLDCIRGREAWWERIS